MNWFEQRIRRYEHRRWTTDDNRRVRPFSWGTELVGGTAEEPDPRQFLAEYARQALENSEEWYKTAPATDYRLDSDIGLTLQANQQAVQDAKRCLRWLEQQGRTRIGILGTSIGSSVGYITMMHDQGVHAGGFFHVSTYFADVVSGGMTTNHVWESLREHVTVDELREYWAPGSPMPYVKLGMGAKRNTFMVYGRYDPTFLPELTENMVAALHEHGSNPRTLELPCGHYSLELLPFSYIAGYRMLSYLRSALR